MPLLVIRSFRNNLLSPKICHNACYITPGFSKNNCNNSMRWTKLSGLQLLGGGYISGIKLA